MRLLGDPSELRKFVRLRTRIMFMGNREIFDEIYREKHWPKGANQNDGIYSGSGSLPENTEEYEDYVVNLIRQRGVRDIIDLGCGDFQVSSRILDRARDASGTRPTYTGIDVASVVVERNQKLYGREGCRFVQADATKDQIPAGDLLLCREVLQHLSNASVQNVIGQFGKFPCVIISNATMQHAGRPNRDIRTGASTRMKVGSSLQLTQPPFDLKLTEVLRAPHATSPNVDIVTQLWERDGNAVNGQ